MMIKKVTDILINKFTPDIPDEHKKWINIFNEIQSRIGTLFESLVAWYSGSVFIMNFDHSSLNESIAFITLRMKTHIFNGYLYIELWNLLDPKGESSITRFVNYWTKDIKNGGNKFTEIFEKQNNFDNLIEHFKLFNQWSKENRKEIEMIKKIRNKNFGHVDYDFEYNDMIEFDYMIETIVFLSDFLSVLSSKMNMLKFRMFKGEPVGLEKYIFETLNIDILRSRFQQEIVGLCNFYEMSKKGRGIHILNCFDSIEQTLEGINLRKL